MALKNGLLLVDTKYEFGVAEDGEILLIDEVKYIPKKEMPTISETFHFPFVLCVCVCVCVFQSLTYSFFLVRRFTHQIQAVTG